MDMLFLLLVFGLNFIGSDGFHQFVIAPNVIRFNHDEVITASILGNQRNTQFTLWFEYAGRQVSQRKVVVVVDQENPEQTTLRVTEDMLFQDEKNPKPTEVELKASGGFGTLSKTIKLSYKTGFLICQTHKPLYTPLESVKVRCLAMEESLKPSKNIPVIIDIVDPNDKTVARRKFQPSPEDNGFYSTQLELPPFPETGIWTAKASFGGKYKTVGIAPFEVREFVLPTFGVTVTVPEASSYILSDTQDISVTVDATYVYGKKVQGTAGLRVYVNDKQNPEPEGRKYIVDQERKQLADGQAVFKIDVQDVLKRFNAPFPVGSYIEFEANVFESATGKEETTLEDSIIFADSPYYFEFKRSKKSYRPGVPYIFKVDMFYANGRPATDTDFKVTLNDNSQTETTDVKGQALINFPTASGKKDILHFEVYTEQFQGKDNTQFDVIPYNSDNQIEVEKVISNDQVTQIRANTNINNEGGRYTGMFFMVVLRGNVVFTVYKDAANLASADLDNALLEKVSPGARIIAFYVDKHGDDELVADAVKFYVDPVCQGKKLKVVPGLPIINPGQFVTFDVEGPPNAWVGFNILDKALLLLNSDNILKENKVFNELESHDLGCGVGGGRNSAEVFETTGLTVLTNANPTTSPNYEPSDECKSVKQRWKRSDTCTYGADIKCCERGRDHAVRVIQEFKADKFGDKSPLIPEVTCYAMARNIAQETRDSLPMKCIMAIYESCVNMMEEEMADDDTQSGRSILDGENAYAEDMKKLRKVGFNPQIRTKFETSFFFEELQLNKNGLMSKRVRFQDSITDWTVQAIGISENTGACIAEDTTVRTYKDFFIQLDLPYKATRLEFFYIKATIFNYDKEITANVYLKGVDGLCYGTTPGEQSPNTQITLAKNSAHTVRFPIVPVKAGDLTVQLSALVNDGGTTKADIVEKKLHVVNEGQEMEISIQVCLDPNAQQKDCQNDDRATVHPPIHDGDTATRLTEVDIVLPENSLQGTASAAAYIESSAMDSVIKAVVNGVASLFREPCGCGEQTMIYTAPIVYGMFYLRQTGQMTANTEVQGTRQIRAGIDRERTQYQKADGSYAAWTNYPTSMWLTAFVAKVFCQAGDVVDGVLDEQSLGRTMDYIVKHQQPDGTFIDNKPVIHREMQGELGHLNRNSDPTLTAFVLISLQECNKRSGDIELAINDAVEFLEGLPSHIYKANPYFLAITTYALALSNSGMKNEFLNMLKEIKTTEGEMIYWKNGNAGNVETTAYALLAILEFDDIRTSEGIVRWLTTQRKNGFSFHSTQDTVVALQALAKYSIRTYNADVNFDVELVKGNWRHKTTVTKENTEYQKIIRDIPVEDSGTKLTVSVSGTGYGRLTIDVHYNIPLVKEDPCPFNIDIESPSDVFEINRALDIDGKCDLCGRCEDPENPNYDELVDIQDNVGGRKKRQADEEQDGERKCLRFKVSSTKDEHNAMMSIVRVDLETGVSVDRADLDKLVVPGSNVDRYEMPSNGRGYIIFYLSKITDEETHFIFRLMDNFQGNKATRQVASIKVYDYYKPEKHCRDVYSLGPNHGQNALAVQCDEENQQCECLQSTCSVSVEQEIIDRVKATIKFNRDKKKGRTEGKTEPTTAFQLLYNYACSPEKANYAVKVRIENTHYDEERNEKSATATVVTSMLQGSVEHDVEEEMTFAWQHNCQHPNVEKGNEYIIIGKDSSSSAGERLRYSLMGSALVIDLAAEGRTKVEKKYINVVGKKLGETFVAHGGCAN